MQVYFRIILNFLRFVQYSIELRTHVRLTCPEYLLQSLNNKDINRSEERLRMADLPRRPSDLLLMVITRLKWIHEMM